MDSDYTLQAFEASYRVIPVDSGFIVEFSEDPMERVKKYAVSSPNDLAAFFARVQSGRASLLNR